MKLRWVPSLKTRHSTPALRAPSPMALPLSVRRPPHRDARVPSRCRPGLTHHPVSRLRSAAEHPQGLGLTRGWYTGHARMGGSYVVNVVDESTSVKSR